MATPAQVPIRIASVCLRNTAMTLSAVMRPVFGFSSVGMLLISMVNCALSLSTSMVWKLRSNVGSAQISTTVEVQNERQARELAPLKEDEAELLAAWREANEAGVSVTAKTL